MAKNSFLVKYEWREHFEDLSDKQLGMLFRAMLDYEIDSKTPEFTDSGLKVAFKIVKLSLDENRGKYQEICDKRRQSGALGGRQKQTNASERNQMLANASKSKQNVANLADICFIDNEFNSSPDGLDLNNSKRSGSRSEQVMFYLDFLRSNANQVIESLDFETRPDPIERFCNIADKVSYSKVISSLDPAVSVEDYLNVLTNYFRRDYKQSYEMISECFEIVDRNERVRNKFAYAVAVLYNRIQGV